MIKNKLLRSTASLFKVASAKTNICPIIRDVFQGNLLGCEITDFFNPIHCDLLVSTVEKYKIDESYLSGNANKILESQHNRQDNPDAYFEGTSTHPLLKEPLFEYSERKLLSVLDQDHSGFPVEVAFDDERGEFYCPAIIREFHSTLKLHNDLGSREGIGWNPIQQVRKQWAFVIKLTQCVGGQTFVYDKKWMKADERYFNHKDNYSYDRKVVEGRPEIRIEGLKGSLIFFDCTRYHRVDKVLSGRRYSMGGFVGLLEDQKKLIVWS